ncbi:MAG: hypothetical protein ACREEE_14930 [Dongiaceae bacterium]
MKAKRSRIRTKDQAVEHGTDHAQGGTSERPSFVMRLPLPVKLGLDVKSRRTVFEKTINGQRFKVVQTVVAKQVAKTQTTTGVVVQRLAYWPSIPAVPQPKRWVH